MEMRNVAVETQGSVLCMQYNSYRKELFTGDEDGAIRVYDTQTGKLMQTVNAHKGWVTGLLYIPELRFLISCSIDGSVLIFAVSLQVSSLQMLYMDKDDTVTFTFGCPLYSMIWDAAHSTALIGSDNYVRSLTIQKEKPFLKRSIAVRSHIGPIRTLALTEGRFFSGGYDGCVCIYASDNIRKFIQQKNCHSSGVCSIIFESDNKWIITGSFDRTAKVWMLESPNFMSLSLIHIWESFSSTVTDLVYIPTIQMVWITTGKELVIYDSRTGFDITESASSDLFTVSEKSTSNHTKNLLKSSDDDGERTATTTTIDDKKLNNSNNDNDYSNNANDNDIGKNMANHNHTSNNNNNNNNNNNRTKFKPTAVATGNLLSRKGGKRNHIMFYKFLWSNETKELFATTSTKQILIWKNSPNSAFNVIKSRYEKCELFVPRVSLNTSSNKSFDFNIAPTTTTTTTTAAAVESNNNLDNQIVTGITMHESSFFVISSSTKYVSPTPYSTSTTTATRKSSASSSPRNNYNNSNNVIINNSQSNEIQASSGLNSAKGSNNNDNNLSNNRDNNNSNSQGTPTMATMTTLPLQNVNGLEYIIEKWEALQVNRDLYCKEAISVIRPPDSITCATFGMLKFMNQTSISIIALGMNNGGIMRVIVGEDVSNSSSSSNTGNNHHQQQQQQQQQQRSSNGSTYVITNNNDDHVNSNYGNHKQMTMTMNARKVREIIDIMPRTVLSEHTDKITAMRFIGNILISVSWDMSIRLWDMQFQLSHSIRNAHEDNINDIDYAPSINCFATCSADKTAKIWDFQKLNVRAKLIGHSSDVTHILWNKVISKWVTSSDDGSIRIWTEKGVMDLSINLKADTVNTMMIDDCNGDVVAALSNRIINSYNSKSGDIMRSFKGHSDLIRSLIHMPYIGQYLSISWDESVRIWKSNYNGNLNAKGGGSGGNDDFHGMNDKDGRRTANGSRVGTANSNCRGNGGDNGINDANSLNEDEIDENEDEYERNDKNSNKHDGDDVEDDEEEDDDVDDDDEIKEIQGSKDSKFLPTLNNLQKSGIQKKSDHNHHRRRKHKREPSTIFDERIRKHDIFEKDAVLLGESSMHLQIGKKNGNSLLGDGMKFIAPKQRMATSLDWILGSQFHEDKARKEKYSDKDDSKINSSISNSSSNNNLLLKLTELEQSLAMKDKLSSNTRGSSTAMQQKSFRKTGY